MKKAMTKGTSMGCTGCFMMLALDAMAALVHQETDGLRTETSEKAEPSQDEPPRRRLKPAPCQASLLGTPPSHLGLDTMCLSISLSGSMWSHSSCCGAALILSCAHDSEQRHVL